MPPNVNRSLEARHRIYKRKVCETVPAVLSRLSEKTRKSNRLLYMSLQR